MTCEEMSREFDILYNNIMSNQAPGLNEYEKSVLLTKAQYEIIRALYYTKSTSSFEDSEDNRRVFSNLVKSFTFDFKTTPNKTKTVNLNQIEPKIWWIVSEECTISKPCLNKVQEETIPVVPVTHDEWSKVITNPFRGPSDKRALRIDTNNSITIYSKRPLFSYTINYIANPKPIILENGLPTIEGLSVATPCELYDGVQKLIIDRAVALAKVAYSPTAFAKNNQGQTK